MVSNKSGKKNHDIQWKLSNYNIKKRFNVWDSCNQMNSHTLHL